MKQEPSIGNLLGLVQPRLADRKAPSDIVNEAVESFTAAVAKLSTAQGEIQKQVDEDETRINQLMKDVEIANIELSRLERIRNRIADLVS